MKIVVPLREEGGREEGGMEGGKGEIGGGFKSHFGYCFCERFVWQLRGQKVQA